MCSVQISLLVVTFPSHTSRTSTLKQSTKEFKPHARTHHIIVIVNIVIIATMSLCHSLMSHATLILYLSRIHANTVHFLNVMCTLVATYVILESLEFTLDIIHYFKKTMSWAEILDRPVHFFPVFPMCSLNRP